MGNQREHTMVVSGVGAAEVIPDGAWLEASVEVSDRDPATAHRGAGVVVDRVVAALDALGVGEADRQTTAIALSPQTEWDGTNHVHAGYAATHVLRLRIRGLAMVAEVLEVLVASAGEALRLSHQAFSLASTEASAARARAEAAALADARERARRLAEAAEVVLGPVLAVRDEALANGRHYAVGLGYRDGPQSAGGAVQAGVDTVHAAVQVTFALQR